MIKLKLITGEGDERKENISKLLREVFHRNGCPDGKGSISLDSHLNCGTTSRALAHGLSL